MSDFFHQINYSASNEDSRSEIKWLDITSEDTILCITGSGGRTLDLLVTQPKKILSIDFNPTQNFLLELKIAGYRYLSYRDFLILMGINKKSQSRTIFHQLAHHLSDEARTFFLTHPHLFERGVIYSGTWEQINKNFSKLLFWKKKAIQHLFTCENITMQHQIWQDIFWGRWFLWALRLISSRWIWQYIIREPGSKLIPKNMDIGKYMHERFTHLEQQWPLRDNDFANLIFLWRYNHTLPLHLREEYFDTIKSGLDIIEIHTCSIVDILQNPRMMSQVTRLSLSDVGSYMSDEDYQQLWDNIAMHCSPGTRFVERQYLIKRPKVPSPHIHYDDEWAYILNQEDTSFIYSFRVGLIKKT